MVADPITEVHREITRLLTDLGRSGSRPDPLVEACLACLEAAQCTSAAATGQEAPDTGAQEALHAVNAAALAIRYALVKAGDERRRAARTGQSVTSDT
ncbi:O-linked N-acetylglucosamine transferase [Streptomyces sp. PRKS01-29]|nr:O-linked N-acetylglucosamine transferase [Streptomyces sabulosicollis]MBI0297169.1 O-linked N-acetylglucosamine transferase [Streptomyces sabulosicollis]